MRVESQGGGGKGARCGDGKTGDSTTCTYNSTKRLMVKNKR